MVIGGASGAGAGLGSPVLPRWCVLPCLMADKVPLNVSDPAWPQGPNLTYHPKLPSPQPIPALNSPQAPIQTP